MSTSSVEHLDLSVLFSNLVVQPLSNVAQAQTSHSPPAVP